MGARQKLNQAYVNGAIACAAFVGFIAQSWLVFGVALVVAILSNLCGGTIRTGRRK